MINNLNVISVKIYDQGVNRYYMENLNFIRLVGSLNIKVSDIERRNDEREASKSLADEGQWITIIMSSLKQTSGISDEVVYDKLFNDTPRKEGNYRIELGYKHMLKEIDLKHVHGIAMKSCYELNKNVLKIIMILYFGVHVWKGCKVYGGINNEFYTSIHKSIYICTVYIFI